MFLECTLLHTRKHIGFDPSDVPNLVEILDQVDLHLQPSRYSIILYNISLFYYVMSYFAHFVIKKGVGGRKGSKIVSRAHVI